MTDADIYWPFDGAARLRRLCADLQCAQVKLEPRQPSTKLLLPLAALGGAVCWGTYLLAGCATESVFLQSFAASAATAIWSEAFARVKKTPAQQYLIIGLIPLVPGGTLYYAMSALVRQDWAQAQLYGYRVSVFVLGIAAGVSLTLSLLDMLLNARRRIQNKR